MIDPTGPFFKYLSAGLGVALLSMGVGMWFLWGAYNDKVEDLGKANAVAQQNFDSYQQFKNLYTSCDTERVNLIEENNKFIRELVENDDQRRLEIARIEAQTRVLANRLQRGFEELGKTPIGATCEARLENVEIQLDRWRSIVIDE